VNYDKEFKKRTFMIYLEKWMTIIRRILTWNYFPTPPSNLVNFIRERFKEMLSPFEAIRHTEACKLEAERNNGRVVSCHKIFQCRKNFLHYNLVFSHLLYAAYLVGDDEHYGWHDIPLDHIRFFPALKGEDKLQDFRRMFFAIADICGWYWVTAKNFEGLDNFLIYR